MAYTFYYVCPVEFMEVKAVNGLLLTDWVCPDRRQEGLLSGLVMSTN